MDVVTGRKWDTIVQSSRITDPENGRLLGYVFRGKVFDTISELRSEVNRMDFSDLSRELDRLQHEMDNHKYLTPIRGEQYFSTTKASSNGVSYYKYSRECVCHRVKLDYCPTWSEKELAFNKDKKISKLTHELEAAEGKIAQLRQKLKHPPTVTNTVYQDRIVYKDKVENVENDPEYNIAVQRMHLEEYERIRIRANILSLFGVLVLAGFTSVALLLTAWALIPVSVIAVALGIINGSRATTGMVLEAKETKLKWEARQNLALQSQMQTYLSEPTTGSTLPTTSGTAQKRLPM